MDTSESILDASQTSGSSSSDQEPQSPYLDASFVYTNTSASQSFLLIDSPHEVNFLENHYDRGHDPREGDIVINIFHPRPLGIRRTRSTNTLGGAPYTPQYSRMQPAMDVDGNSPSGSPVSTSLSTSEYLAMNLKNFVPVDPFLPSIAFSLGNFRASQRIPEDFPYAMETGTVQFRPIITVMDPLPPAPRYVFVIAFILDTIPRQIYLYFLLGLPSLYFSRVTRIFIDAESSMPDIQTIAAAHANHCRCHDCTVNIIDFTVDSASSVAFSNLKSSWERFIDSLMREWKTINIVSVLSLSAILTTLQIDAAAADPIIRHSAIMALICALMSLLYGCMYIIRFSTMRRPYKAAAWAQEAQQTRSFIWWNVWVFLAMPATWLAWSIILFLTCIIAFLWRTGSTQDPTIVLSPVTALGPRIATTAVFTLGIVYFIAIARTLRRYGEAMDREWEDKVLAWGNRQTVHWGNLHDYPDSGAIRSIAYLGPAPSVVQPYLRKELIVGPTFETFKVMDLWSHICTSNALPNFPAQRDIQTRCWANFISDVSLAWNNHHSLLRILLEAQGGNAAWPRPQVGISHIIGLWNTQFFHQLGTEVILCRELSTEFPYSPFFSIYMRDLTIASYDPRQPLASVFTTIPDGLHRIEIFEAAEPTNSGRYVEKYTVFAENEPLNSPPSFTTTKVMDLRFGYSDEKRNEISYEMPDILLRRDIRVDNWKNLIDAASAVWNRNPNPNGQRRDYRPQDAVIELIHTRNSQFFMSRATQLILCEEFMIDHPDSPSYAIYIMDLTTNAGFGPIPEGLMKIAIYELPNHFPQEGDILGKVYILSGDARVNEVPIQETELS